MVVPLPPPRLKQFRDRNFEETIDKLRIKKEHDQKLKIIEDEKRQKFREDMLKNKGSYDITKIIEDFKESDTEVNLFQRLRQRGKSITFDFSGVPIV